MVIGLGWHICARGDEGHELCFISIQSTSWYPKDHTHKHIERDTTCVQYKGANHTVTHPQKGNLKLHSRLFLGQSYSFRYRDQSQTKSHTHAHTHVHAYTHKQTVFSMWNVVMFCSKPQEGWLCTETCMELKLLLWACGSEGHWPQRYHAWHAST